MDIHIYPRCHSIGPNSHQSNTISFLSAECIDDRCICDSRAIRVSVQTHMAQWPDMDDARYYRTERHYDIHYRDEHD